MQSRYNQGFTLVEIVVVVALISIMLFFATPRFSAFLFEEDADAALRWLLVKTRYLKAQAVQEQKDYVLHVDLERNFFWISDETMDTEEALAKAMENGYPLAEGLRVLDVTYPNRGRVAIGSAEIVFFKKGYSDQAIIHLSDRDEMPFSFIIEPFLSKAVIEYAYVQYDAG